MNTHDTMLAALKAAEPVLADMQRIINKRLTWGSHVSIPELETVRAAIALADAPAVQHLPSDDTEGGAA